MSSHKLTKKGTWQLLQAYLLCHYNILNTSTSYSYIYRILEVVLEVIINTTPPWVEIIQHSHR